VLKNPLSGILSVGHPNISVVSGKLSVVGIPPVPIPIPKKIQLLMYGAGRPVFFLEPVSFLDRFIQTGFYLGNRFKVNKKNINKRFKINVKEV